MQTKLAHVRINVKDLERAVHWYTKTLGWKVETEWPKERPNYVHFEAANGAVFGLMENEDFPSAGRFNFHAEDVDSLWGKLKNQVRVLEPLFETEYGSRKFTIQDPDGNELGFVQED
ncbi:VOC family protein [Alkalicoccus luteus]|uniref:VOC family protein n=1 Tax=Alkalicoccus luteus TaxID=1237094 RepID=A0A969PV21_9BACI|nr:VOC family protein [Alkalicoccus luteus]NJP38463.1 VOC family protein [Alkalicoccus luteus]